MTQISFPLEQVKPDLFKRWLAFNRESWNDPNARINTIALAGSDENAKAFFNPVTIGGFSKMVALPISTVRLYVRRGLIEPLVVSGKYRFMDWNVAQAEAVKLWSELGLTLEDMQRRKLEARREHPGLQFFDVLEFRSGEGKGYGIGYFALNPHEGGGYQYSLSCSTNFEGEHPVGGLETQPINNQTEEGSAALRRIQLEMCEHFKRAREGLELEREKLEARIARARVFEARLGGEALGAL
jgi:DNA-binding transcriptional MerR regulator